MKILLTMLMAIGVNLIAVGQNIIQVEYFLDTDAGVGKNTLVNVTPLPDGDFPVIVNVSGVTAGYHQLYMRTKDNNGLWSLTSRKYIEVVPVQTPINVVTGEYFFDQDPGAGRAMPLIISPQDSIVMQDFTAAVSGLPAGFHKLYTRFKDSNGKWSLTSRSNIEIVPVESKNNVVKGEYFFDHEPGFGVASSIAVSPKDSIIAQNFTAAISGLTPGYHVLYQRLMDSSGRWSQTTRHNIEVVKNPDTSYIVSVEYFFKKDPGFGNADQVQFSVPAQNGEFTFNIPSAKFQTGIDTLVFLRTKDSSAANWSLTNWGKVVIAKGPLPLTLLNFNATKQDQTVLLNWQTENEVNTGYFNIQRSLDGSNFTTIGKVNAKGNSTLQNSYNYTNIITGEKVNKLFYRLQETDLDGKITYSDVAAVNINAGNTQFTIMPNPASNYIIVVPGSSINPANATIVVTDLAGHALIRQKMTNIGSQRISISSFAKGVYTVSIITPSNVQTQKLLIR